MSAITAVPDLLRTQAARIPDQPFVRWRERSVSYGEFDARTDAVAAGLADLGVRPGDVVSVMLPNSLGFSRRGGREAVATVAEPPATPTGAKR